MSRFAGRGNQRTPSFEIAPNARQWRVTATCRGGSLQVAVVGEPKPLVDPGCADKSFGFSIRTGPAELDVTSTGEWEVVVDQQLNTPISEPALVGMSAATDAASGRFYGIDQNGTGRAALYELPNGRLALRFEPFEVTANADLFVWVSQADAPHTSREAISAPYVQIEPLKATSGTQNYLVPESVPAEHVRSVIVWCEPVRTAYAAASLSR